MKYQHLAYAVAAALALGAGAVNADDLRFIKNHLAADLKGVHEVPLVSSAAKGSFKATIDEANQTITYELTYEGLTTPVTQAHIHIGQHFAAGGVSVYLCGNPAMVPVPPNTPACPPTAATVTGTLTPANIVGPAAQGVAPTTASANDFAELVGLLRNGETYANVHTIQSPSGEIRGQVHIGFTSAGKED